MKLLVPRETRDAESRVSLLPETAAKLADLGLDLEVESGAGLNVYVPDGEFRRVGATVCTDRKAAFTRADVVLCLNRPPPNELAWLKPGCVIACYLDPFSDPGPVAELAAARVTAIAVEMIPRTTLAQKMDALSSQASLGGYAATVLASDTLNRAFPMMMTPSGTIAPARVFVIGAGVAGLQAIATAKRLGAVVEAFDTRPVVEEQVRSLGARFAKIDLGGTEEGKGGYAKALTDEQLARQREGMARYCADADVVIAAAQVFGTRAPMIVTREMIDGMKPGSVIIDCAIAGGGNVEGSEADKEVTINGVRILAPSNLPGRVAYHASQMYSNNLGSLLEHAWDSEKKAVRINLEDDIMRACVIAHGGKVLNDDIRRLLE